METCPPFEKKAVIGEVKVFNPTQMLPYRKGNGAKMSVEPSEPKFTVNVSILLNIVLPQFPFFHIVERYVRFPLISLRKIFFELAFVIYAFIGMFYPFISALILSVRACAASLSLPTAVT